MSFETVIILLAAGILAGCISALAGGSALISFPVLMAAGLPPVIANATNFMTALMANTSATYAYRRELRVMKPYLPRLAALSIAGGATGSLLLINISPQTFAVLVPWLILTATLLLALSAPIRRVVLDNNAGSQTPHSRIAEWFVNALIFAFAVYGGFFGAGLGIIMMAGIMLMGEFDYHHANALKNFSNGLIGLFGVLLFTITDLISWPHALVLMAGSAVGGLVAVRVAGFIPQDILANAMIAFGFALSGYYFWLNKTQGL